MATTVISDSPESRIERLPDPAILPELRIYSHSTLFYWWPAWLAGYLMAFLTYAEGNGAESASTLTTSGPGLTFTLVLLFVILFTNVRIRGMASLATILGIGVLVLLIAWLGWWDDIWRSIPDLSIRMSAGFYLAFSTALLVIWALTFFVFDRLSYWRVRPGQLTDERIIGGGEMSYDTRGMLFEQRASDFFRHIILGLGAGDLRLITTGAKAETIEIPNVLFAQSKVNKIQRLVAIKPDEAMSTFNPG